MRHVLAASAILLAVAAAALQAGEPNRWTLALELDQRQLEGTPLIWSKTNIQLLARDGRLWSFAPGEAGNSRKASATFHPYSASQMRQQLSDELGKAFEVTGTGHYLVAHPRGQKDQWARRFEDMYRLFVHYFSLRGFELEEPEFPLVAIVWNNQQGFLRYARSEGSPFGPDVLGYYSGRTNRTTLYDQTGSGSSDWSNNADTIIHEVTHQTAYNTGVHRRFSDTPRWLAEGLASMFEARGVWNSRDYPQQSDRINRGRLHQFRQYKAQRKPGTMAEMIGSDRTFEINAGVAYAESWALTFYLAEKRPRQYAKYVQRTAGRPVFQTCTAAERMADFTAVFGTNLKLLEVQYLRFIDELR